MTEELNDLNCHEDADAEPRYAISQVERMTGVTRAMLLDYDDKGLLCPARSKDMADERRLYSDADIERLKRIVVLRAYNFSLKDIKRFLDDPDSDFIQLLQDKIYELKREENRLRNLILFAKFVSMTDTDFFEGLAVGPEDIDAFADAARQNPVYQKAVERIQQYSDEDWNAFFEELDEIVERFATLDEEEGFAGVERCVDAFCMWWDERVAPMDECGYLGFWAIFEDDSIIVSEVEAVGGELASGSLQMSAFYVWMKRLMLETSDLMASIAKYMEADIVLAISETQDLSDIIDTRMGASDMTFSVLQYQERMLEDAEFMEYLDPEHVITLTPEVLANVQRVFALFSDQMPS